MRPPEISLWLYMPFLLLLLSSSLLMTGCSEAKIQQQCLYLRSPTLTQQQGAAAEMQAHPELPYIRIQAHDLDDALRQNRACWHKNPNY